MDLLAAAKPWTYWMAIPVFALCVVTVLGFFLNYLRKAVAIKYPKQ